VRSIGFGRGESSALANDNLLGVATSGGVAWYGLPEMNHLRFDVLPGGARALARSPDGSRHAFEVQEPPQVVRLARTNNGSTVADLRGFAPRFSPDGRYVATSLFDFSGNAAGQVFIWSAQAGLGLATIDTTDDRIVFSPDSSEVLTMVGANIVIWSLPDGKRLRDLPGKTAAYSPDGNTLAVATGAGIQLYERRDGRFVEMGSFGNGEIQLLRFTPDGQQIVAHADYASLVVWDVASGQELSRTVEVFGEIVQFNSDASLFAAAQIGGDAPPFLRIYRVSDGTIIYTDTDFEGGSASFGPNNAYFAVTYINGDVVLFNAEGQGVGRIPLASYDQIAFSPDGSEMAACHNTYVSALDIWRVVDGKPIQRLIPANTAIDTCAFATFTNDNSAALLGVDDIAFGGYLLGFRLKSWNRTTNEEQELWRIEFSGLEEPGVPEPLAQRWAYTPTRQTVAWLDRADTPFIQNLGGAIRPLGGQAAGVIFSPDGARLALVERGSLLRLVPTEDISATLQIPLASDVAGAIAFSPDGEKIALFQLDGRLNVWNAADGALLWQIEGVPVGDESPGLPNHLVWSPDGQLLITGNSRGLGLYQASDGAELQRRDANVYRMAIGPAGRILATVGYDGRVLMWGVSR
jgi:WD40 repeat protein